jgi:hypothetical protein
MPDTNRRRSSRHLRLLVRATRQIPISASPPLGHAEDWGWWARGQVLAKRHKVEAKKDSVTAQELPAKQVGTYDEAELCKLLLEIAAGKQ